jgi:hypothetical protein
MAPGLPPGMTRPAAAAWIGEDPQAADKVFRDLMSASTGTPAGGAERHVHLRLPLPGRLVLRRAGLHPGRRLLADPLPDAGHRHRGRAGLSKGRPGPCTTLTCPKAFLMFTTEEGAEDHCQVGSPLLSAQRTFDWLQETSAAHPPPAPHKPPRQATSAAGARRHVPGQRSKTTRSCRNEGLTPTHIPALDGMFTRHSGNAALFL